MRVGVIGLGPVTMEKKSKSNVIWEYLASGCRGLPVAWLLWQLADRLAARQSGKLPAGWQPKSELKLLKMIRCLSIAVMFSGLYILLPIFFPRNLIFSPP